MRAETAGCWGTHHGPSGRLVERLGCSALLGRGRGAMRNEARPAQALDQGAAMLVNTGKQALAGARF